MKIRSAEKSDLLAVEKILAIEDLKTANGESLTADELGDWLDEKYFLVAEDESGIVGAMFGEKLKAKGVMLWEFAVKEDCRGKGVGGLLLDAFEKNMASDGLTWVILYAPAENLKTLEFYQKRGYSKGKLHYEFLKSTN